MNALGRIASGIINRPGAIRHAVITTDNKEAARSTLRALYANVFRRNQTYVTFVIVGAIVADLTLNKFCDSVWEINNKGVSV